MIVQKDDKWEVRDSSGKKLLGTHETKGEAAKQLAAIEISKKKRKIKSFSEHVQDNS